MGKFWGRGGDGDDPLKKIGDFLGTGMTSILGIFGVNPRKTPIFGDGDGDRATKRFGDGFGDGDRLNFGDFWGKIPENPQISGRGRGKESWGFLPH